jgi:hypothetical protein
MPWSYSGGVRSITPSTSDDNWTLDAVSAGIGKVKEFSWGGQATSSTAMQTRVSRANSEAGSLTTGNVANLEGQGVPTNDVDFVTTYGTTQPTLNAADIFSLSWNDHGGVVRWVADPEEEVWLITGQTLDLISCRNAVGTASSSYGVVWSEIST